MRHTIIIVVLFLVLGLPSLIMRADVLPDGADLFIEAVRCHAGNHTLIHSLSYVAQQTRRLPTRSEKEIEKEAVEAEAAVRKAFEGLDVKLDSLDVYRDHYRRYYAQASILSRFTVKYKAPSFSRKLLSLQIERQGTQPGKWEMDMNVIEANVVNKDSESEGVQWFSQEQSALVNDSQAYMGTLFNFGRLQGQTVFPMLLLLFQDTDVEKYEFSEKNIAKFKAERDKQLQAGKIKGLITVGTTIYDGDAKAYVVESSAGGKIIERYWIDVNRGYVCPLLQYYDDKGKLLSEYKSRDYFLHEKSGLWFPQVYEETTTDKDGKPDFKEYRIDKASLDVNFPIADDEFLVEITGGSTVTDSRKGAGTKKYKALDNGVLSLGKGGLDLESKSWLLPAGASFIPQAKFTFGRILGITTGVLLILLGIYFQFYRKT